MTVQLLSSNDIHLVTHHNLEKRDNRESQILFEGHFKNPQIPFISVDLSDPCSDKSQGALRIQAMHDSGCAKTTIRTDVNYV